MPSTPRQAQEAGSAVIDITALIDTQPMSAFQKWIMVLIGCTVVHRVGRLVPGAQIVLVLAAASHRGEALDATTFLIDWLKTKAPFWKREEFLDGTGEWVAARDSDDAAAQRWGEKAAQP